MNNPSLSFVLVSLISYASQIAEQQLGVVIVVVGVLVLVLVLVFFVTAVVVVAVVMEMPAVVVLIIIAEMAVVLSVITAWRRVVVYRRCTRRCENKLWRWPLFLRIYQRVMPIVRVVVVGHASGGAIWRFRCNFGNAGIGIHKLLRFVVVASVVVVRRCLHTPPRVDIRIAIDSTHIFGLGSVLVRELVNGRIKLGTKNTIVV